MEAKGDLSVVEKGEGGVIDLMKWLANGVTAHPPPPSFSGPQLRRNLFAHFHWGRIKKGGKQNNSRQLHER